MASDFLPIHGEPILGVDVAGGVGGRGGIPSPHEDFRLHVVQIAHELLPPTALGRVSGNGGGEGRGGVKI